MDLESPDSHDLNFSNRPLRTRMPGGTVGAQSLMVAPPYADFTIGVIGVSRQKFCVMMQLTVTFLGVATEPFHNASGERVLDCSRRTTLMR
jgi:hypothetical protein